MAKRHSRLLRHLNQTDVLWHAVMLAADAPRHAEQHMSARINFSIIDKMSKLARRHIDRDGPLAPYWAQAWFATGRDPGHRLTGEPAAPPMFPYQRR